MVCFLLAIFNAIIVKTANCAVNALVEATPISGPACVYAPPLLALAIDEPTTLTTPKITAPCRFAFSIATNVSAVSPLWEMAMMISPLLITGLRYLNSEAYSTSTLIRHNSSKMYSATRPACQLVPQATITIRFAFMICSAYSSIPFMVIVPLSRSSRPRRQSWIVLGCSKISSSMK